MHWMVASEVYVRKIKFNNHESIDVLQPIVLLNVGGKLFFSLLWTRLEDHMFKKNKLIDLSVQNGCISKLPGCWEDISLVLEELKAAKTNKSNLTAAWSDVANAYGFIPHHFISVLLLQGCHHPEKVCKTLYFVNFSGKVLKYLKKSGI